MFDFEGRQAVPLADFAKWVGIQALVSIGALGDVVNMLVVARASSSEALGVPNSWVAPGEAP